MSAPVKVSIIVPVYNEAQTIESVVDRILAVDLGAIEREVLIVNDGSDDETRTNIDGSAWRGDPAIRTFDNPINLGKGAAIRHGLRLATDRRALAEIDRIVERPYGGIAAPRAPRSGENTSELQS